MQILSAEQKLVNKIVYYCQVAKHYFCDAWAKLGSCFVLAMARYANDRA